MLHKVMFMNKFTLTLKRLHKRIVTLEAAFAFLPLLFYCEIIEQSICAHQAPGEKAF
jgi:hypothetical protein